MLTALPLSLNVRTVLMITYLHSPCMCKPPPSVAACIIQALRTVGYRMLIAEMTDSLLLPPPPLLLPQTTNEAAVKYKNSWECILATGTL